MLFDNAGGYPNKKGEVMNKEKIESGMLYTVDPGKEVFPVVCPDCGHVVQFYFAPTPQGLLNVVTVPQPRNTAQARRQRKPELISGTDGMWTMIKTKELMGLKALTEKTEEAKNVEETQDS